MSVARLCSCSSLPLRHGFPPKPSSSHVGLLWKEELGVGRSGLSVGRPSLLQRATVGGSGRRDGSMLCKAQKGANEQQPRGMITEALRASLWVMEGVYVVWLFFLPFAPGDPVWAIKTETLRDLLGLSLNFFFILPLSNAVGIHVMEAPLLHPTSEGLFNFIIGWTFMFAPLLFTDYRRNRFKGSLDILWCFQMFLTNVFLIPYMAIRLNDNGEEYNPKELSKLGLLMTRGAAYVGLIGGAVCLLSAWWALFGRGDGDFGSLADRWNFFKGYIGSERLAYAFIWDMGLYAVFQPWLIGDNLGNMKENKVALVNFLRFIPVLGLAAYLLVLDCDKELE